MDFEAMIGAFRAKWLNTFQLQQNSIWFHIPNFIFKQLGGIECLAKCDFEISKMEFKQKFRMKDSPSPSSPSNDFPMCLPAFQSASCQSDSSSNHLPTPCF
ncbi:hypothetical protein AMECASPLE_013902 [Ameca splendens]|uniref:Uncharacterized protein n=1 Tax=Ameca splendens TaxID=208324 RepID=A0ABV1A7T0_9TELE